MAHASFTVEAMIRGYHICRDIRSTIIDKESPCEKELGNLADPFAVGAGSNFALFARVQNMRKFALFKNLSLYGIILSQRINATNYS